MQKKVVLFAAPALALAAALVLLWKPNEAVPIRSEKSSSSEAQDSDLRRELTDLKNEVRQTRRVALSAAKAIEQSQEPKEEEPRARPNQDATEPAPVELDEADMRDGFEEKFLGDNVDRQWSAQMSEFATSLTLKHLPSSSKLTGVDCKGTICKVQTSHEDIDTYRGYMLSAFVGEGNEWKGQTFVSLTSAENSEAITAVAYLLREGEKFEPTGL